MASNILNSKGNLMQPSSNRAHGNIRTNLVVETIGSHDSNPREDENQFQGNDIDYMQNKFLNKPGLIKYAQIHREANKPLKILGSIQQNTLFCDCCGMPLVQEGVLEKYDFFKSSTNDFDDSGFSIPLYFYFFKCLISLLLLLVIINGLPVIIYTHHYTNKVVNFCEISDNYFYIYTLYCLNNAISMKFNNSNWEWMFLEENLKMYRDFGSNFTGTENAIDSIVNYSILNFMSILVIYVITLVYAILNYERNFNMVKYLGYGQEDYTLVFKHLKPIIDSFEKYYNELKPEYYSQNFKPMYTDKKNNAPVNYSKLSKQEQFESFIKGLVEHYTKEKGSVMKVTLCYDVINLLDKAKELKLIDDKINQITYSPTQIEKNKEKQLENENRQYFEPVLKYSILNYCNYLNWYRTSENDSLKNLRLMKKKVHDELNKIIESNLKFEDKDLIPTSAFVTFDTIKHKEEFYKKIKIEGNFGDKQCLINKIYIRASNPPDQIAWKSFTKPSKLDKYVRRLKIGGYVVLSIGVCFGVILGLQYGIGSSEDIDNLKVTKSTKWVLAAIISIFIILSKHVFKIFLKPVIQYEKLISTELIIIYLSCIQLFFNICVDCLIPFFTSWIKFGWDNQRFLATEIFIWSIFNILLSPISTSTYHFFLQLLNIYMFEKKYKKDTESSPETNDKNATKTPANKKKRIVRQKSSINNTIKEEHGLTQKDLNSMYGLSSIEIWYKYSYLCSSGITVIFLFPVCPLAIIITSIGLGLTFFLEKFNYIYAYHKCSKLDQILHKFYDKYFAILLFTIALSDIIFNFDIFDSGWSIVNFLFALGVFYYQPSTNVKKEDNDQKIDDIDIDLTYEIESPVTAGIGLKRLYNEALVKNLISKDEYKDNFLKLEIALKNNPMDLNYITRNNLKVLNIQRVIKRREKLNAKLNENTCEEGLKIKEKDKSNENMLNAMLNLEELK